jgi:hypothetical protein
VNEISRKALLRRGFALEYTTLGWNVVGIAVLPRAPVNLDADHHLPGFQLFAAVAGEQGMQLRDTFDALRQPGRPDFAARAVLDLDIVVVFGPVVTDKQHPLLQPLDMDRERGLRKTQLAP